jgi:RNA recognition motif-containing protein
MFKIFVGNLDYKVRAEQVRELFALYVPIEDLVMPADPKTNKPRGFAIVMVRDPELGAAAIRGVQGKRLMGRQLVVNEALKKKGKATPAASEPARVGPFGPRMFRTSQGHTRGSRNPRRSSGASGSGGGATRPSIPPATRPAASSVPPPNGPVSRPDPEAGMGEMGLGPPKRLEAPPQEQSCAKAPVIKARPKLPPSSE